MLKTFFVTTIKLVIAAALITWLVSSGKLDFKLLLRLQEFPLVVLGAIVLVTINFLLVSWRWRSILETKSQVDFPLTGMLRVTWIGQFFSSVLPGSVSGDLLKMLYIQEYDPKFSKKYVFASILIDRAMGLTGLIILVGMSSLVFSAHILKTAPAMAPLININYTLAVLFLSAFGFFFFYHHLLRRLLVRMEQIMFPKLWQQLTSIWDELTAIKSRMLKAMLISIMVQFLSVVIFWSLISPFISGQMDFIQALAFIPIGLMTLALPVAPSGLGVGHAIFQELFKFSGIENGASLFNIYFVVTVSVNLLGVIPYLLNKKKN